MMIWPILLMALLMQVRIPGPGGTALGSGGPTITYVQGCVNSATAVTVTCALGSNITSGNLLVVTSKSQNNSGTGIPTFTSSLGIGCTWVQAVPTTLIGTGTPFNASMYTCLVPSTGAETVSVTWAGTTGGPFTDITIAEYSTSTSWNSTVLDQSASSLNSASTTSCATGTTSATTNPNDLIIAVCENFNSAETWGALAGFTNRSGSSRNTSGFYDRVVTSTGTQSATIPLSTADSSTGMIAAFKSN